MHSQTLHRLSHLREQALEMLCATLEDNHIPEAEQVADARLFDTVIAGLTGMTRPEFQRRGIIPKDADGG